MEKSRQGSIVNIDSIGGLSSDDADGGDSPTVKGTFSSLPPGNELVCKGVCLTAMKQYADSRLYKDILETFNQRYALKKRVNLIISILIAVLGVTSFLYGLRLEPMPTIFRWMTVDGTVFTTISAILCFVVNLV